MENNSKEIGQVIINTLEKMDFGEPTPLMFSPEDMSPVIGIIVNTDNGHRLAYNIKVEFLGKEES